MQTEHCFIYRGQPLSFIKGFFFSVHSFKNYKINLLLNFLKKYINLESRPGSKKLLMNGLILPVIMMLLISVAFGTEQKVYKTVPKYPKFFFNEPLAKKVKKSMFPGKTTEDQEVIDAANPNHLLSTNFAVISDDLKINQDEQQKQQQQ